MIILVGGEKGGTGKTTIATNLAVIQSMVSNDLLLIDTDIQSTASFWCSIREQYGKERIPSIQKFGKEVRTETLSLNKKYADIIIDAGGRDSVELRSALLVSDKAIVPLRPSQFDIWTIKRISDLTDTVKEFNQKLQVCIVISQDMTNPLVQESNEAREFIKEFDNLTLLETIIFERRAYRKAAKDGLSVVELRDLDKKASKEMISLHKEVYNV